MGGSAFGSLAASDGKGSGMGVLIFLGVLVGGVFIAAGAVLGAPSAPDKRTQDAILLSQRK